MEYDVNLTLKPVWEGVVRVDDSFGNYVSDIQEFNDYKQLTIKDGKYPNLTSRTFDNFIDLVSFPAVITALIVGKEIKKYMKCSAFYGYQKIEKTKGLIRKKIFYEEIIRAKGFRLYPIENIPSGNDIPLLASYRARIGADHSFDIKSKGLVAFATSSVSSTYEGAYSSITCVIIASNEKPVLATLRKKGEIFNMICNSNGIKEESLEVGDNKTHKLTKTKDEPLEVLKLRLAKGEITPDEYENLKKMLESD